MDDAPPPRHRFFSPEEELCSLLHKIAFIVSSARLVHLAPPLVGHQVSVNPPRGCWAEGRDATTAWDSRVKGISLGTPAGAWGAIFGAAVAAESAYIFTTTEIRRLKYLCASETRNSCVPNQANVFYTTTYGSFSFFFFINNSATSFSRVWFKLINECYQEGDWLI